MKYIFLHSLHSFPSQDHSGSSHGSLHRCVWPHQRSLLQGDLDGYLRSERHHLPEGNPDSVAAGWWVQDSLNSGPSYLLPGIPLPALQWRQEHPGAGWIPGQAGPGEGGPCPGSGGAEEDPRLCGAVPSTVPERTESAPSYRIQGGHGPHGGLDLSGRIWIRISQRLQKAGRSFLQSFIVQWWKTMAALTWLYVPSFRRVLQIFWFVITWCHF